MSETTDKKRFLGLNGIKLILDTLKEKYSPLGHTHDDLYYTEAEVDDLLLELTSGNTVVAKAEKAEHATNADKATNAEHSDEATHALNADNAVKAEQDTKGNVIDLTYETKEDAIAKLQEAKDYADVSIANLVDSAPETLDTLGELAAAFNENAELIDVLNKAITEKATVDHVHSYNDLEDKTHYIENVEIHETRTFDMTLTDAEFAQLLIDNRQNAQYIVNDISCAYSQDLVNNDNGTFWLVTSEEGTGYLIKAAISSSESTVKDIISSPGYTSITIDTVHETIHKLDEKFIPDTIATKEYVDAHILSKEEVITLLTETGFISPATTTSGDIYTDSDGDIYVM